MDYQLYYWPSIQGRGEFVRLALEAAGADYEDVARQPGGVQTMLGLLADAALQQRPFAPPFLKAGEQVIGQTANILQFLGGRHHLAPADEAGRRWAHQLQLTIADFIVEIHDTHHPISCNLYYHEQEPEAARRASDFVAHRLPKFLGYFSQVLAHNSYHSGYAVGTALSYVDLSLFQLVEGLRYAFSNAMAALEPTHSRLIALHQRVAQHAPVAAYLASPRRIAFNQDDIFRHYPELDAEAP